MTTKNSQIFQTLVQGFSFWMKHGKELYVGDSMVVKPDEPYKGHTCGHGRPKSPDFSSMNFMVIGKFFSKTSITIRQHQHHLFCSPPTQFY
jgi:hypothetical protein